MNRKDIIEACRKGLEKSLQPGFRENFRKYVMTDFKYYEYEVRAVENGYILEASYRMEDGEEYRNYKSQRFVFVTFDEAVKFMASKPLVTPPAIN